MKLVITMKGKSIRVSMQGSEKELLEFRNFGMRMMTDTTITESRTI